VFIPSAFISGISGQFFRQSAVTIATSTVLSAIVSLTLSPALCALLFKPHVDHAPAKRPGLLARPFVMFFDGFNACFDWLANRYGRLSGRLARVGAVMLVLYAGLVGLAGFQFARTPTGFITNQDLGYLLNIIQLPPGASLARTDAVVREATQIVLDTPGIGHAVPFAGFDATTGTNGSFAGIVFAPLKPFAERAAQGLTADHIQADLRRRLSAIKGAFIITLSPPPVRGIGTAGGFKMYIQDKRGRGPAALEAATQDLVQAANKTPGMQSVFTLFNTKTPKVYADIDRGLLSSRHHVSS
jgi:multidrug efflux pump subunit AcrB